MSKYYTKTERDALWIGTRKLLVSHNIMNQDGTPVEGHEKVCNEFRKIILTKIKTVG